MRFAAQDKAVRTSSPCVRGAPRDALIADLTDSRNRCAAFGLRQSLDTVGAFIGPAAAVVLMWALGGNFFSIFRKFLIFFL